MPLLAKEVYAKNRSEWHDWLSKNHSTQRSIWLVYDKGKNRTLSYQDIVEEALCFGWIDSTPGKVDDTRSKIYVSKRKPRSVWSRANKERVKQLLRAGRIQDAGLKAIKVAEANGAWDALNKSDDMIMPQPLRQLLSSNPEAKTFFDKMPPSSHKIILEWIYSAKTDETKMKRIKETVELAARGIKAHHYRQ